MAMSILREERGAQATLTSILGATRFKTYFYGVLVPTRCPHTWGRVACGMKDSYEYLLKCYKLENEVKKGHESLAFLVKMARKAMPARPGTIEPRFVIRQQRRREGENQSK